MTAFGKLLVFLNLLFSVVTGALIVVVFTTRANWKAAYTDAANQAKTAEAAYKAERAAHENDLKQKTSGSASLEAELVSVRASLVAANEEVDRNKKLVEEQNKRAQAALADSQRLEQEMIALKSERTTLAAEQNELRTKLVNIQRELDKQREGAVLADLQAKNLLQKNQNLLQQVELLTVRIRDLEQAGAGALVGGGRGGESGSSILNPPPKAAPPGVRGKVTEVGSTGTNLASINIGSDSGLSPGNVLTVFIGSEYKGDLTITAVDPKTAVGKFTPVRRGVQVLKDDNVITSFAGVSQ
jgi:hypothetical protein